MADKRTFEVNIKVSIWAESMSSATAILESRLRAGTVDPVSDSAQVVVEEMDAKAKPAFRGR